MGSQYCADIMPYAEKLLPPSECARLPYWEDLCVIRRELERSLRGFPDYKCILASIIVARLLDLPAVDGYYRPPCSSNTFPVEIEGNYFGFERHHALNRDERRGIFADITQDQFTVHAPPVALMDESSGLFMPSDNFYYRLSRKQRKTMEMNVERLRHRMSYRPKRRF